MTLDDLERPKRYSCRNKKFHGAHPKNFNEDRSILSAAKCRSLILVSRNIRYADIRWCSSGRGHQRTVGLSTTILFGSFGGYLRVKKGKGTV